MAGLIDWTALEAVDGEVPWEALKGAIDAVVAEPPLWGPVAALFGITSVEDERDDYLFLYVPYILSMAAARMSGAEQQEVIGGLLRILQVSLALDWDFPSEVALFGLEVIGGPVLEPLLAEMEKISDTESFPLTHWMLAGDIAAELPVDAPARVKLGERMMGLLREPEKCVGCEDIAAYVAGRLQLAGAVELMEKLLENPELEGVARREIEGTLKEFAAPKAMKTQEEKVTELVNSVEKFKKMSEKEEEEDDAYFEDEDEDEDAEDEDSGEEMEWGDEREPALPRPSKEFLELLDTVAPQTARLGEEERGGDFEPFVREERKVGRNDPCPCGSGRKFKKCCGR